jgi:type IV pilus assembly protein PilY1
MWEFTPEDDSDLTAAPYNDSDLGYTYAQPQIVPAGDKNGIEWYVVFGNGYNSLNTTNGNAYSSKLFILKLEGPGVDGDWDLGTDYWKIDTTMPSGLGTGSGASFVAYDENDRNGMSSPAIADSDDDGIADRVYAGDLLGHLWAFDITGTNEGNWDAYKSGSNKVPLLTATDENGDAQPITSKPALGFNTQVDTDNSPSGNTPNLMVYVGTGSYLTQPDLSDTSTQTFYGVWDAGENQAGHTVDRADSSNSDLVEQTIATDLADDGSTVRVIDPPASVTYSNDFATTDFGWFMDLPESGERVVIQPAILAGIAFFNTLTPSTDACGFGGTSWTMFADAMTGQAASLSLIDFDNNGQLTAGDETAGGHVAVGTAENMIVFNATTARSPGGTSPGLECPEGFTKYIRIKTLADGSTVSEETCLPGGKLGRTSWRELKL